MRIVFTSDGVEAPGPRYRCMQFFPYFEREGVRCEIYHAYGKLYNRAFNVPVVGPLYKTLTRGVRAVRTASASADLMFLQRTAFPQSAIAERIAHRRGVPLIFDFDDNLLLGPGGVASTARERAFYDAVRVADHCIAGNQFLADAARVPHKTTIIPTVIDTDRYVPTPRGDGPDIVIGWMGTAGNFASLARLAPSLRRVLAQAPNVTIRIVSNATFKPLADLDRVEQIRWSPDSEIALLQSFDVGLMPLEDTEVSRGKCAFKMIQYMAVGAPVVVSAVGANVEVMHDTELGYGLEGFDWTDALLELVRDPDLRARFGAAGRERAVAEYSIHSVLDRYLDIFRRVAAC